MTESGPAFRVSASPPADAAGGGGGASGSSVSRLWPDALEALVGFVAHDLRNALNAVAVNLEVVRSRSARGADASGIAPFASTAASQFEAASAAVEALVAFARPEPAPADVAAILSRLARLVSLGEGTTLRFTDLAAGRARTAAPPDVVRAVVARSVLTALGAGHAVACEIRVGDDIFLHVTGASHTPPPDSELVAIASAHGVRFASRDRVLELRFPVVDPSDTPQRSA